MTTVLDASALVALLVGEVAGADVDQFDDQLVAPDLIVAEVGNGLRRAVFRRMISRERASLLLQRFLQMPIEIESSYGLVERAFELLDNVSVPDACYVALAEARGCGILTADARLARAPGIDVRFTLV
jgi:predicted nucleic acid-binding protein